MLCGSTVIPAEVLDAIYEVAMVEERGLVPLPSKDLNVSVGEDRLFCSAGPFQLTLLVQAVIEDVRQLRYPPPSESSVETAVRVGEQVERAEPVRAPEIELLHRRRRPSQEAAVLDARAGLPV